MRFVTIVLFASVLTVPCLARADLEAEALAYRMGIKSGEVSITGRYSSQDGSTVDRKLHVVFDGDRSRKDRITNEHGSPVRESYSRSKGFSWHYSDKKDGESSLVATMTSLGQRVPNPEFYMIPDVRIIGMIPNGFENLVFNNINDYIGSHSLRAKVATRKDILDGEACSLIEFDVVGGRGHVRMWIAPNLGPSVVRYQHTFPYDERRMATDEVSSRVSRHQASGIYFPTQYLYQRKVGDSVVSEDRCTLEVVSLNQPIEPSIFELSGMDVPVGHPVVKVPRDPRGRLIWDGAEVVAVDPPKGYGAQRWSTGRRALVGVSALLAIAAVAFAWKWSRATVT